MGNGTERDLAPDPREMPRRRFMIADEHVDIVIFSVFRDGTPQQEAS